MNTNNKQHAMLTNVVNKNKKKKDESTTTKIRKFLTDFIIIVSFLFLTVPTIINNIKNKIDPSKIYLNICETGWSIPLNRSSQIIRIPKNIGNDEPVILRFGLTQNNYNPPVIRQIFITFPADAEIKSISYKGWDWERSNDSKNRYFLNYAGGAAKGPLYNLPAFEVKFKNPQELAFEYDIVGDRFNPIHRTFTIDATQKYSLDNLTVTDAVDVYNTASPPVVKVRNMGDKN